MYFSVPDRSFFQHLTLRTSPPISDVQVLPPSRSL